MACQLGLGTTSLGMSAVMRSVDNCTVTALHSSNWLGEQCSHGIERFVYIHREVSLVYCVFLCLGVHSLNCVVTTLFCSSCMCAQTNSA